VVHGILETWRVVLLAITRKPGGGAFFKFTGALFLQYFLLVSFLASGWVFLLGFGLGSGSGFGWIFLPASGWASKVL